jgi:hypothetical protein
MKNITKHLLIATIGFSAITFQSCKGKDKDKKDAVVNMDTPTTATIPVAVDDQLTTNAKDAIKDFAGVSATVSNGEITLTGNIKRDKLPTLMQTINALHAKKINNKLTITN